MREIATICFDSYTSLPKTGLKLNQESIEDFMIDILAAPKGMALAIFEGDVAYGGILGIVEPWSFNKHIQILKEMGWFVLPEYREKHPFAAALLYRALIKWAKSEGATAAVVSATNRGNAEETARMYEEQGLVKMDTFYMGVI